MPASVHIGNTDVHIMHCVHACSNEIEIEGKVLECNEFHLSQASQKDTLITSMVYGFFYTWIPLIEFTLKEKITQRNMKTWKSYFSALSTFTPKDGWREEEQQLTFAFISKPWRLLSFVATSNREIINLP